MGNTQIPDKKWFDNTGDIDYKIEERTNFRKARGKEKLQILEKLYPKALKSLKENNPSSDLETIKNQPGHHFSEIVAMNHFLEKWDEVIMIVTGYMTKGYDDNIRKIIWKAFNKNQAELICSIRNGGIPDLLVKKNDGWQFVEVKTIKKKGTERHEGFEKKQREAFPRLIEAGIQIDLAILRPID